MQNTVTRLDSESSFQASLMVLIITATFKSSGTHESDIFELYYGESLT